MIKAVGYTEFGGPEVLRVLDLPEPHPGPAQVRIKVSAAAVHPSDVNARAGVITEYDPEMFPPADAYVFGWDAAGAIDELGDGVRADLAVGTEVIALLEPKLALGAQAQYVIAPAESVVAAPRNITPAAASTLLMNALTARMALDALELPAGATIAVTGAAGAVGGYVVQLAKADGLTVVADAADKDRDLISGLGADHVLPRGDTFAQHVRDVFPSGVDGAIDAARMNDAVPPAVRDNGIVTSVAGFIGAAERGVQWRVVFVRDRIGDTDALVKLRDQAEQGVLTMRVAATFPFDQAADAHTMITTRGVRGRPVLLF